MGKRYLKSAGCMDVRCREMMIGPGRQKLRAPNLAQRDGDEGPEHNSHEDLNTDMEGEVHPQLFAEDATRRRLGFDRIHTP